MSAALDGRPVVVGAGLAGLLTALTLAPEPVVLLAPAGDGAASAWAQGGIAAAIGAGDDPGLHLADTLAAGDGLCDRDAAAAILAAAPAAVAALERLGAVFDRGPDGALLLGLEAAHGRRRIVHAAGAATGREIMRALGAALARTPSVTVLTGEARRLLLHDGAVAGLAVAGPAGPGVLATDRVVLATGGLGGLFADSTNPAGALGTGLALAARAGAALADPEFVQFHPTALDTPARPMGLVSEAVRGEGAVLVDETGARFLAGEPGAELAPRDVVARAVWRRLRAGHQVFLDAREKPGRDFAARFPGLAALCRAAGLDPSRQPIPVRPAAHYHMGGIAVDGDGRSTVPGLWACGEVAATGLHGANRLASNSLAEAAVCAGRVAASVAGTPAGRWRPTAEPAALPAPDAARVRLILSRALGVERDGDALRAAVAALLPLAEAPGPARDPATVGLTMAVAALDRRESRGAHHRTDHPDRAAPPRRTVLHLDDALAAARAVRPPLARSA
ncbi:L-aspartate oxidase [Methylobacterium oryzihabitans]|uniref:L-aspartate oxidase n=1 Tax=Methylobacterium oryzihabitans TaxID=2499852 RepID=A0A3S2VIK3_9HYPH|nr:L-aspartate oxidase [Methylobacterium oryzihabitans]RVU13759.1 L-aspartate oxidase [Methylobacterium oryzihabitans]